MSKLCIYCGNNPISHPVHKFYESMDILFSPIRQGLSKSWIGRAADTFGSVVGVSLLKVFTPLGVIKTHSDLGLIKYDRARVIWEEAIERRIPIEEIKPFGRSIDLYKAKLKNRDLYFMNLPRREKVATSNLTWIDDKYLLKKKLRENDFPVPAGGSFMRLSSALNAFRVLKKPVIVKPRAGSRGRHTTTMVNTEDDLIRAFKIAKQLCLWVMVEEHLYGDIYRGTVIGGKLIGVLGGSSPQVVGDGQHTIAELIKIKDAQRPERVKEIKINDYFMQRQGLDLNSIPVKDKIVKLSEKIGLNYGGTSYDCTDETHPDTKLMLAEAGKLLDISILGFDFIIPDITKSYKDQKCGIIECNGAPFIDLHHHPLIGKPINAAKYVWDLVT